MAIDHRQVHFRDDDLSEVIAEVEGIAERATGKEWVTISPWVDPENLPVVSMLQRIFSARSSRVPEVTWFPAHERDAAQLGVLHGTGAKALERLLEAGVAVPEHWRKLGDHSKRGLLFAVHPDTGSEEVIEFSLAAAAVLAGIASIPTDDRWVAQVSKGA